MMSTCESLDHPCQYAISVIFNDSVSIHQRCMYPESFVDQSHSVHPSFVHNTKYHCDSWVPVHEVRDGILHTSHKMSHLTASSRML